MHLYIHEKTHPTCLHQHYHISTVRNDNESVRKIKLSGRYERATYLISATVTLAASFLVLLEPLTTPFCIIIKLISIPIVLYLIPIAVEFIVFVSLMIITGTVGYSMQ